MIFDIVVRSLASDRTLVSVEELLGDCVGSRMPDVQPAMLSISLAQRAVDACPTSALRLEQANGGTHLVMDYGECTGCGNCVQVGQGAFRVADRFVHCGVAKPGLIRRWDIFGHTEIFVDDPVAVRASSKILELLGRALNIRQVDAGSCNGCESEIGALTNPYYDLERFGIHFVASPKHADMLLVTGPVTRNMSEALNRTYEATPSPRLVIAVGACGCTGGVFVGSYAVAGAVDAVIPVDGYIPGCPPTPAMLLTGILRVLGGSTIANGD
jgi:Ni,Fe-hydrogenase III small subunit/NAD-dependent dihydropyrimidine dehydrogenase PreA subunit